MERMSDMIMLVLVILVSGIVWATIFAAVLNLVR